MNGAGLPLHTAVDWPDPVRRSNVCREPGLWCRVEKEFSRPSRNMVSGNVVGSGV